MGEINCAKKDTELKIPIAFAMCSLATFAKMHDELLTIIIPPPLPTKSKPNDTEKILCK